MNVSEEKRAQLKRAQRLVNLYNDLMNYNLKESAGAVMGVLASAIYNGDFDIGLDWEYRIKLREGNKVYIDIFYVPKGWNRE